MNIPKAIKILTQLNKDITPADLQDLYDAAKLGIEALKRIKNARDIGYSVPAALLPGETKD